MKIIIYLTLATMFIASCSSNNTEEMTSEDLKSISADCDCGQIDYKRNAFGEPIKGSVLYDINSEKVFSGTCEEKWGDGSRKEIRQYSNGKLHGNLASWDENGVLRRHLQFTNGKQDGDQYGWHSNKNPESHLKFKNGIQNGEQLKWNTEGKLIFKKEYLSDGNTVIHSGFDYRSSNMVREVWSNLKVDKELKTINKNSIEINAGGNDEEYHLWINDKMSDEQIINFITENVIKEHFNNDPSKFVIGTSGIYEDPSISLNSDVYGFGYENKKESFRIASMLIENIKGLHIPFFSKDNNLEYYKVIDGCSKVSISGYNYAQNGIREVCDFEWFQIANTEVDEYGRVEAIFSNGIGGLILLSKIEKIQPNGVSKTEIPTNSNDTEVNVNNEEIKTQILYKINDPDGYSNLRDAPKGNVIQKVYENELFEVLGEKDGYKKVKLSDGTVGYIHGSRVIKN